MPSLYAHERFGQQVLERMSGAAKDVAEQNRIRFGIGLQGPDFLFFFRAWSSNEVARRGQQLHRDLASGLFSRFRETLKNRKNDSGEMACALGTVCHFMLDSSCHWYVERRIRETGESHYTIETEFERFLMEKDGLDPLRFPVWNLIPVDKYTAGCLSRLYGEDIVDEHTAERCLKDMRMIKRLLMAPTPVRQKLIRGLLRLSGNDKEVQGLLMTLKPVPGAKSSARRLLELSDGAVEETAALAMEYYRNIRTDTPVNARFNRNFE